MKKVFSSFGVIFGTLLTFFVGSTLGSAIYGGVLGAKLAAAEPGLAANPQAISDRIEMIVMDNLAVVTAIGGIGIFLLALIGLKLRKVRIGYRMQMNVFPLIDVVKAVLAGALMQVFFVALEMLTQISRLDTEAVEQMGNVMTQGSLWASVLIVALWVPFYEEFLFRGILFTGLRKRMPTWLSIAVCGLVFGMIHLNLWQLATISVIGWMMAYSYERTASFWVPYGMHLGLNLTGVLLTRSSWSPNYSNGIYVVVLAAALVLALVTIRSLRAGVWKSDREMQMDF